MKPVTPPALAALLLVAAPSVAGAASASARTIRPLALDDVSGWVEFGIESENQDHSLSGGGSTDTEELEFSELLHLDLSGSVYHPRFLRYSSSTEVELVQDVEEDDTSSLLGGTLDVSLLPKHPYGLDLFIGRHDSQVDRPFLRDYDLTTDYFGYTFHYRTGVFPFSVGYRRGTRESPDGGSRLNESVDSWSFQTDFRVGETTNGNLSYDYREEERTTFDVDRENLYSFTRTELGGGRQLTTHFRRDRFDDGQDSDLTTIGGAFAWPHSETLWSRYHASVQTQDTRGGDTDGLDFGFNVRHQLYGSLTSLLEFDGDLEDASFGKTDRYTLSLRENYTKRLGGWGRLTMSLSPGAQLLREDPDQETGFVTGETHSLTGIVPVELSRLDIDPASVVVSDSNGIPFVQGLDYALAQRGAFLDLTRIVTGNIADGETVFVDYDHSLREGDILDRRLDFRMGFSFVNGLDFFGELRSNDEKDLDDEPAARLQTERRLRLGASLNREWYQLEVEYEDFDNDFDGPDGDITLTDFGSFRAHTETLSLVTPASRRYRGRCSLRYRGATYLDEDRDVSQIAFSGGLQFPVGPRSRIELEGEYLRERWDNGTATGADINDLDAFGAEISWTWFLRHLDLEAGARYSNIEREGVEETRDRVFIKVRRSF